MKIYDVRWESYGDTREVRVEFGFRPGSYVTFFTIYGQALTNSRYSVSMGEFGIIYVDINFDTKEVRVVWPEGLFPETVVASWPEQKKSRIARNLPEWF